MTSVLSIYLHGHLSPPPHILKTTTQKRYQINLILNTLIILQIKTGLTFLIAKPPPPPTQPNPSPSGLSNKMFSRRKWLHQYTQYNTQYTKYQYTHNNNHIIVLILSFSFCVPLFSFPLFFRISILHFMFS